MWNSCKKLLLVIKKTFLIVGIGINTNHDPKDKSFSSISLKNITNKKIDNNKLLNMIKKNYEKFLSKAKIHISRIKKIYK